MADQKGGGTVFGSGLSVLQVVVPLVAAAIGAAATYLTIGREDRKVETSETVADRDYLLKVTDKVYDIAASDNVGKRCLASYLVASLPERYAEYRRGMLRAMDLADLTRTSAFCVQGALDEIAATQKAVAAAEAAPEAVPVPPVVMPKADSGPVVVPTTAAVQVTPTSLATASSTTVVSAGSGRYAVDVFWCDGAPGETAPGVRAALAAQLAARFRSVDGVGRIRVRPLPAAINSQAGYNLRSNVIRHEGYETPVAKRLDAVARQVVTPFETQLIGYQTRNYVSVFVCA